MILFNSFKFNWNKQVLVNTNVRLRSKRIDLDFIVTYGINKVSLAAPRLLGVL